MSELDKALVSLVETVDSILCFALLAAIAYGVYVFFHWIAK